MSLHAYMMVGFDSISQSVSVVAFGSCSFVTLLRGLCPWQSCQVCHDNPFGLFFLNKALVLQVLLLPTVLSNLLCYVILQENAYFVVNKKAFEKLYYVS